MRTIFLWSPTLLAMSGCNRLGSIPCSPQRTPQEWLLIQPFMHLKAGSTDIILVQPSSTILVYLLGMIALASGLHFLRIRGSTRSRKWWGAALLLWGLGALFAGTSYQAFSYEIKCAGRKFCSWTSWWEVVYLILSAASVDAMVIAGAYTCSIGKGRKALSLYAVMNIVSYVVLVLIGAFALIKFLISFELLLLVTTPGILALFALNAWRYFKYGQRMDLALLGAWLWLGITIGIYFLYFSLDVTHELWQREIWFSENDVLHIGLIMWMLYMVSVVANRISDVTTPVPE